ncbi:MAG: LacI family DNA-binding transcriptional regulator [Bacteroidales bacterium]
MSNTITIKDLAKVLGISVSTVSRALKNHPDISSETRSAVQDLAKKMKYKPNGVALSLRQKKSKMIGVVIPQIIHHFFSCVISGIERIANENGYNVVIFQSNEDYEREISICQSIINSRLDGLLISMSKSTRNADHFREIQEMGTPLVFFDRICGDLNTDRVVVDDFQGALAAVRHLISIGCRRIAHLSAPQTLQIAQKRQLGYIEALKEANIQIDKDLMIPCDNQTDALEVTRRLMSMPVPPDGIFAVNDLTAAGSMYALHKMGYRVPKDVAVCGFTDGMVSTLTNPTLTTVEQHGDLIGELAMNLLLRRIADENKELPTVTKVIKTNLVVRESTLGFGQD